MNGKTAYVPTKQTVTEQWNEKKSILKYAINGTVKCGSVEAHPIQLVLHTITKATQEYVRYSERIASITQYSNWTTQKQCY